MVMGTMHRTLQSAAFAKAIQEHAQADVDIVLQWGFDETLQWAARGRSADVARGCLARIHKLQSEQHKKLLATRGAIPNKSIPPLRRVHRTSSSPTPCFSSLRKLFMRNVTSCRVWIHEL